MDGDRTLWQLAVNRAAVWVHVVVTAMIVDMLMGWFALFCGAVLVRALGVHPRTLEEANRDGGNQATK